MINVLVTGGGSPGIAGTIYALRKGNPRIRIIVADIRSDVVGRYLADAFYVIPKPSHIGFIDKINEICEKEWVDVILPQVEDELNILASNHFRAKVAISKPDSIYVASNKQELAFVASTLGIPLPKFMVASDKESFKTAVYEMGYPEKKIVVKPPIGSGMRGFRILCSKPWDYSRFIEEKPNRVEVTLESFLDIFDKEFPKLMVVENLPGKEYTVDCYRSDKGFVAIPRLREHIRNGITFDATVVLDERIIKYCTKLASRLDLKYCFGFQFKEDEEGRPKLIECNPRVQGTMVVSLFAGFNMIYNSVREAAGLGVDLSDIKLKDGLRFRRYWGGVAIDGDEISEIHGIF